MENYRPLIISMRKQIILVCPAFSTYPSLVWLLGTHHNRTFTVHKKINVRRTSLQGNHLMHKEMIAQHRYFNRIRPIDYSMYHKV